MCCGDSFWRECSFGGMQLWVKLACAEICTKIASTHAKIAIFCAEIGLGSCLIIYKHPQCIRKNAESILERENSRQDVQN